MEMIIVHREEMMKIRDSLNHSIRKMIADDYARAVSVCNYTLNKVSKANKGWWKFWTSKEEDERIKIQLAVPVLTTFDNLPLAALFENYKSWVLTSRELDWDCTPVRRYYIIKEFVELRDQLDTAAKMYRIHINLNCRETDIVIESLNHHDPYYLDPYYLTL